MTVVRGCIRIRLHRENVVDLLVKTLVVEKDVVSLVIIYQNFMEGFGRFSICARQDGCVGAVRG